MSVGIVIVSHSAQLAAGVVQLAGEMAQGVVISAAGGTDDGGIGTSLERIEAACREAAGAGEGVVILCDLGSAVMTSELYLEMLDEAERDCFRLVDAPLVEGAVAAGVAAAQGEGLDAVAGAAHAAWGRQAAGEPAASAGPGEPVAPAEPAGPGESAGPAPAGFAEPAEPVASAASAGSAAAPEAGVSRSLRLVNPAGLHARPAATLVKLAAGFDARITVDGADAASLLSLVSLGAKAGQEITVTARGPQEREALEAIARLVEDGFGEMEASSPGS